MTAASIKGRFLFGGSQGASIPNLAGAGNLAYHAGAGAAAYHAGHVDLGNGSYFTTPFDSTPRDRTMILVASAPFYENVYDSGTYDWPPTVLKAVEMEPVTDHLLEWASGGYLRTLGSQMFFRPGEDADMTVGRGYGRYRPPVGYRDGTFSFLPMIIILGHGPAGRYGGFTWGRNMTWLDDITAPTGAALAPSPTRIGSPNGATATSHQPLLAYQESGYVPKAQALADATELVNLLEPRGWKGVFHNPVRSE